MDSQAGDKLDCWHKPGTAECPVQQSRRYSDGIIRSGASFSGVRQCAEKLFIWIMNDVCLTLWREEGLMTPLFHRTRHKKTFFTSSGRPVTKGWVLTVLFRRELATDRAACLIRICVSTTTFGSHLRPYLSSKRPRMLITAQ